MLIAICITELFIKRKYVFVNFHPPTNIDWESDDLAKYDKTQEKLLKKCIEKGEKEIFSFAYCGMNFSGELQKKDLKAIKFKNEYWKKVSSIMSKSDKWVGIHVRRTDHAVAIRESGIESFIKLINLLLKNDETMYFYLATDDANVEKELKERFKERIVTQEEKIWGRDTTEAMKSGVIDLLCLSQCNKILGSCKSVFSKFAAEYGDCKLIICKNEIIDGKELDIE